MSSTKISKDYQDGYDLGYKKGYVDGAKDYQPKKGKWIAIHKGYVCSNCNKYTITINDKHYCFKCGADMRGEENG